MPKTPTMTRRLVSGLLLVGGVALVSKCAPDPHQIRYRLTLEVETPEGLRTGSGVIEHFVRWNDGILRGLGAGPGLAIATLGEAVIVDLGPRGLLLCALTRDLANFKSQDELLLPAIFPFSEWGGSIENYGAFLRRLESRQPTRDVPFEVLPLLARFRAPMDPTSAERVQPGNLAASFGAGIRLRRVTAQITDDPVSPPAITRKMPWISELQGSIAHTYGLERPLGDVLNQLVDGSFWQGK
jgi:hypothetical protein